MKGRGQVSFFSLYGGSECSLPQCLRGRDEVSVLTVEWRTKSVVSRGGRTVGEVVGVCAGVELPNLGE